MNYVKAVTDNDVDVENGEAVSWKKKPAPTFMEGFFKEVIIELGVHCLSYCNLNIRKL